jgi:flagellar basal-body rod modification protein FlgD
MNVAPVPANTVLPTPNTNTSAGSTAAGTAASNASDPVDTQGMFMQLLTAQLENQSPLDPVDPTQFTSQLVQFNMLDQLSQINQTLQNALTPQGLPSASAGNNSNPSTQGAV